MKQNTTKQHKGTIVLIHGNSSSSKIFKATLESDSIPYNKIAVDLLGHGNNQPEHLNQEEHFSIVAYKKDILKQLEHVEDDVLLVGNSLGGHIAIEIASQVKNLKGLVIFGTPPLKKPLNFDEGFLPVEELQTFFKEEPSHSEIETTINAIVNNKEAYSRIVSDFKKANPLVRKAIATDAANGNFSNEYDYFIKTETPKYIISGDQDISINSGYLQKITDDCNGSCNLIVFENCGHYPSIEQPEKFNNTINKIATQLFN